MSRNKKRIISLSVVFALLLVFTLAGCGSQPAADQGAASTAQAAASTAAPATTQAASQQASTADNQAAASTTAAAATDNVTGYKTTLSGQGLTIGFNQGSSTVDFLKKVGDDIQSVGKAAGVNVLYTESNFDSEQIMKNVNTLLMQGAKVIVDFNVNAEVGGNIVDVCEKTKVPVIGIDVPYKAPDGTTSWFFGANNLEAGKIAGRGLGAQVEKSWNNQIDKLVLFFNSENGEETKKRLSGIYDGLVEDGKVKLDQSNVVWIDMGGGGSDTTLQGMQKLTDFLTANPSLKHIGVGTVNDQTAQGCLAAVQQSKRDSDVFIVSHGADSPGIANLKLPQANSWIGSVAYYPEKYGEYIIPMCIDLAAGKNVPKHVLMSHTFVTRDNINQIYPK